MGENAVAQKWGNSSDPETDRTKNLQKFTVIPHHVDYEGIFFSKGLAQNWMFCEFVFLTWRLRGKGLSFQTNLTKPNPTP